MKQTGILFTKTGYAISRMLWFKKWRRKNWILNLVFPETRYPYGGVLYRFEA